MTARHRLPHRRLQLTERITVGQTSYTVSIGLDPTSETLTDFARELFIEGPKSGSDLAFVLADAAVLISLARQYGIPAEVLAQSMSRVPLDPDGDDTEPASPIGAAIDLMLRLDAEHQAIAYAANVGLDGQR